ncbi:hypothetical protein EA002_24980, partial [Vibrio anguillarum]|nr:hypothetical protein [Vibrio anguillarum]
KFAVNCWLKPTGIEIDVGFTCNSNGLESITFTNTLLSKPNPVILIIAIPAETALANGLPEIVSM